MNKNWFVENDVAYLHIENDAMFGESTSRCVEILAKAIGSKGRYISEVRMVQNISHKITESIKELASRYQILIISGGVGITHNCNTLSSLSNAIGCELEENIEAKLLLERYLKKEGMEFSNVYKKAITLPKSCVVIPNEITGIVGYKIQNIMVIPSDAKSFR
ncbi:MAG: molybdopterin-binding protein, partial [Proteobacteria bacterium]|nr:molybdopterin-binding protein [Pseudomonadota bacterium]